jgi:hypothetical protein
MTVVIIPIEANHYLVNMQVWPAFTFFQYITEIIGMSPYEMVQHINARALEN